jgi:hypothetical protein
MMQAKKIDTHYPFTITENSMMIPLTISQTSIHITQNSSEYSLQKNSSEYLMVMLRARFPSCEVQIWYILLNKSTYFITEEGKNKSRSREKR